MISINQRLNSGMQFFERLLPGRASRPAASPSRPVPARRPAVSLFPTGLSWKRPRASANLVAPSMESVLAQCDELTPYSAFLGLCEDGLPLMLDLTNPAPGSLMVVGDAQSGKTDLMRSLLASVDQLNTAEQVVTHLAVRNPEEYQDLALAGHCREILPCSDAQIPALLLDLSNEVQQRRRKGAKDIADLPAVLFCIDDLADLLAHLDGDETARLHWIAKHGPRSRVWLIASLSSENSPDIHPRLLEAFRTHLVCGITDRRLGKYLCSDPRLNTRDIDFGRQFFVPFGEQWLRTWICHPQAGQQKEVQS